MTDNRFTSMGFEYFIDIDRVVAVCPLRTAQGRRLLKWAKDRPEGAFLDFTHGKSTKSLLLLEDGTICACAFSPPTVAGRLNSAFGMIPSSSIRYGGADGVEDTDVEEEEEDDEDDA